jgi:hypothetical protein
VRISSHDDSGPLPMDGVDVRRDDEQYDPELGSMSRDEREAFLEDLADQLAPALSRFISSWALLEGETIDAWRVRNGRDLGRRDVALVSEAHTG